MWFWWVVLYSVGVSFCGVIVFSGMVLVVVVNIGLGLVLDVVNGLECSDISGVGVICCSSRCSIGDSSMIVSVVGQCVFFGNRFGQVGSIISVVSVMISVVMLRLC